MTNSGSSSYPRPQDEAWPDAPPLVPTDANADLIKALYEAQLKGVLDHWPAAGTPSWPAVPSYQAADPQADLKKSLYQAQITATLAIFQDKVDAIKATRAEHLERVKTELARELETTKADLAKSLEETKTDLARSLEETKAGLTRDLERAKLAAALDNQLQDAVYRAYLDTAKAGIDRARAGAEFVQKAAAAIATVYTAILAFSFKIDTTANALSAPLPVRGFIPVLFLGIAIACASFYLAYFTRTQTSGRPALGPNIVENQDLRSDGFSDFTNHIIEKRSSFARAAVLSLALAVAWLPIAYVVPSGQPILPFWTASGQDILVYALIVSLLVVGVVPVVKR
jgi:hypothetical protein